MNELNQNRSQTSTSHLNSGPSKEPFSVVPLLSLHIDSVQYYFQQLAVYDTLQQRFPDIIEPTWSDVVEVIQRMGDHMYLVLDNATHEIVAEFTLESFTGRSAQSHFSTAPEVPPQRRVDAGKFAADYILSRVYPNGTIYNDRDLSGQYWLDSLFGLIPVKNRAALKYTKRIGFTQLGILPHGMLWDGIAPIDAVIITRERTT